MEILSCCKLLLLSTEMLLKDRWHDLSYWSSAGMVNSRDGEFTDTQEIKEG